MVSPRSLTSVPPLPQTTTVAECLVQGRADKHFEPANNHRLSEHVRKLRSSTLAADPDDRHRLGSKNARIEPP